MIEIEERIRIVLEGQVDAMRVPPAVPADDLGVVTDSPRSRRRSRVGILVAAGVLAIGAGAVLDNRAPGGDGQPNAPTDASDVPLAPDVARVEPALLEVVVPVLPAGFDQVAVVESASTRVILATVDLTNGDVLLMRINRPPITTAESTPSRTGPCCSYLERDSGQTYGEFGLTTVWCLPPVDDVTNYEDPNAVGDSCDLDPSVMAATAERLDAIDRALLPPPMDVLRSVDIADIDAAIDAATGLHQQRATAESWLSVTMASYATDADSDVGLDVIAISGLSSAQDAQRTHDLSLGATVTRTSPAATGMWTLDGNGTLWWLRAYGPGVTRDQLEQILNDLTNRNPGLPIDDSVTENLPAASPSIAATASDDIEALFADCPEGDLIRSTWESTSFASVDDAFERAYEVLVVHAQPEARQPVPADGWTRREETGQLTLQRESDHGLLAAIRIRIADDRYELEELAECI